jgi:hypothetical protein
VEARPGALPYRRGPLAPLLRFERLEFPKRRCLLCFVGLRESPQLLVLNAIIERTGIMLHILTTA